MSDLLKDTVLYQMLGADGMNKLKEILIEVIVDEVRDQLRGSSDYIISPDDISSDLYDSIIQEVKTEILSEYKEKIIKSLDDKLNSFLQ